LSVAEPENKAKAEDIPEVKSMQQQQQGEEDDDTGACCGCRKADFRTRHERCLDEAQSYQRKFPHAPPLASTSLRSFRTAESFRLVDARTQPEQAVSMIQGAVSLQQFRKEMESRSCIHQVLASSETEELLEGTKDPSKPAIIVYCTIGYRSGLEATHLRRQYPDLEVYSLDGIVAYTHALEGCGLPSSVPPDVQELPPLIDPKTSRVTRVIHTFGGAWDLAPSSYNTVQFRPLALVSRLAQVGGTVVVRTIQGVLSRPTTTPATNIDWHSKSE
jgi:rhodanese-related sulfurtransferase